MLPFAHCVLAPNPSVMTLDGTNTWLLHAPGDDTALVIDPGPPVPEHLRAIEEVLAARNARLGAVLLTHRHLDHSEAAREFARRHAVGVRAIDPRYALGDEGLGDGDELRSEGLRVRVLATPGHTTDSVSFLVTPVGAPSEMPSEMPAGLLTGDTVLGRGTAMIDHPDGVLAPYLDSVQRLLEASRELAAGGGVALLPGHGPAIAPDEAVIGVLEYYLAHRRQRIAQVREALAAGCGSAREVVERVYADVDQSLWPAAEHSVRATLEYLRDDPGGA